MSYPENPAKISSVSNVPYVEPTGQQPSRMSVAFPKLHSLFGQNLDQSKSTNIRCKNARYIPIGFNQIIELTISKIGKEGETRETIVDYLERRNDFCDFDDDNAKISFSDELQKKKSELIAKLRNREIEINDTLLKQELILLKQSAEGSERFAKAFTKVINITESLQSTAQESSPFQSTDISDTLGALKETRDTKIETANRAFQDARNLLSELEQLFLDLCSPEMRPEQLDEHFQTFLRLKESMKNLLQGDYPEAEKIEALLNAIENSPLSKLKFFEDLTKTDSSYLQILNRSVVKAREDAVKKKEELNLAEREQRSEGFDQFDLRFDPRSFIIFKDMFNRINNFTVPCSLFSRSIEASKLNMIDPSKCSFFATLKVITGVSLYVIFQMAKAVTALSFASLCYLLGSAYWVAGVACRFIFIQGWDRVKDLRKNNEGLQDNSQTNVRKIANQERITRLPSLLKNAEWYKTLREEEARSQIARMIEENGKKGEAIIQKYLSSLVDMAKAHALNEALKSRKTLLESIQIAEEAGERALKNLRSDMGLE
ncbi:MAG: hypothetical protein EB053_03075 [Chlamydiae bacterium]|nr:hypothetical protein [Chlamydiota bacterium]